MARGDFGDMVSAVARGEVGIVMSFERSRLSRNDLDWHQLVYLCRRSGTLVADEQGLYDPSLSGDCMVLGIRGQVSELECDSWCTGWWRRAGTRRDVLDLVDALLARDRR
jgi:DNA invertase Pin-like site-specific DNA recombinase